MSNTSVSVATAPPRGGSSEPIGVLRGLAGRYPIAFLAALGIVAGALLLLLHPGAARIAFAAVAIGGGLPLVWTTLRNMTQGRFYVDTIASLAIIGSVALGEYLAGALVETGPSLSSLCLLGRH